MVKMAMGGGLCFEDIGVCDANCINRCMQAHPRGQVGASCVGPEICRCLFDDCKTCTEGLLPISLCGNNLCNSTCTAEYTTRRAEGYCAASMVAVNFCMCDYDCW